MKWDFNAYGKVEIVAGTASKAGYLVLAKADAKSDPLYTFGADELDKLFETLVNSDMPVHDPALVMYGDEEQAEGFPRASIPAAQANDKGYNKAYEPFQLKAYKPTNFELHVKFGQPSLWAFCDNFVTNGGRAKAPRAKLTFQSAKAPATPQRGPKPRQG
jgi:hypothetical protein